MKTTKTSELWVIFLFCLIGLVFTLPSFFSGFYSGHNALTHLIWTKQFAEQLWDGDPYPRWLMTMNNGLGSPAFYFYFPLPYFFTSLFHAPFLHLDPDGWLQMGLACAAAFSLSGVSCYLWLRETFGQGESTVGTLVYMLLPYHLLVDLYYRFALTEFWAFVFMPLCLYFADRIRKKARFGVTGAAISYSLLFLTHLPTVLIFSPILLCYGIATSLPGNRIRTSLQLSCALLLGSGLAAFYWIPAIATQANVSFTSMSQGEFSFENNFLFSLLEIHPKKIELGSYHSFVTFTTLITLIVCLISWLAARRLTSNQSGSRTFWLIVGFFSFYMMLDLSSWLWQSLPFLPRIQFPYRFNMLLALAMPVLAAEAMQSLSTYARSPLSKAWIVALGAFIVSQTLITSATVYKRASSHWDTDTRQTIDREITLRPEVAEYQPRWANANLFPVTLENEILKGFPVLAISSGEGDVSVDSWESGRIVLQARNSTPLQLIVKHFYYPNWQGYLESQKLPLVVFPSANQGFISVNLPAGSHRVILALEPGPEESLAQKLSILSLIILLVLWGRAYPRKTHKPRKHCTDFSER